MADDREVKAKAMRAVKAIFDRYHLIAASERKKGAVSCFDRHVMENMKLIDATCTPTSNPAATCTYELVIDGSYANLNNVMHGGAAGVIFDMSTTTALGPLARPGFWDFMGGVTRCLNIAYLRAVPIGTTVRLHSEVVSAGRTAAMIRGEMTSLDGTKVYATAEHQKIAVPTLSWHNAKEFEVEWDREMREIAELEKAKAASGESRDGYEGLGSMKGKSKL